MQVQWHEAQDVGSGQVHSDARKLLMSCCREDFEADKVPDQWSEHPTEAMRNPSEKEWYTTAAWSGQVRADPDPDPDPDPIPNPDPERRQALARTRLGPCSVVGPMLQRALVPSKATRCRVAYERH